MRAASLRARLLARFLRRFVKPRSLQEPDPVASRAFVNRISLPAPFGVSVAETSVGGVPGEWLRRRARAGGTRCRRPVLVYLHGGAYAIGSPGTHRAVTGAFALRGFRVLCPDYRLAPEHSFPAALDDAVAVYRGLLEAGEDPGGIVFAGESAGGGLALATLVLLRELGLPRPAAAALFSPWTDLALTGRTLRSNEAADPMFYTGHAGAVARHYLGTTDPRDPLASPLYADLGGLPPLLIHVGETEVLFDDAARVAAKARSAGVEVSFESWPVVPHAWQLLAAALPEARRSLDEAAGFLLRRTGSETDRPRVSPAPLSRPGPDTT